MNLNINLFAQKMDRYLNNILKDLNMEFTMPKGYIEIDSICSEYNGGNGKHHGPYYYILGSKDSSVLICVSNSYPTKTAETNFKKYRFASNNPFTGYLHDAYKRADDTTNHKLTHYPKKYLQKSSYADDGGEYFINCTKPFKEKYYPVKEIYLHKYGNGDITITYFCKKETASNIDTYIKQTAKMLKYKR